MTLQATKESRVEIQTVKIKLGKTSVELTVSEAKELRDALEELFGAKVVKEIIREDHFYPPYYIPWRWGYRDNIWCNADNTTTAKYLPTQKALCLTVNKEG